MKKLNEMTLEELWKLFPIELVDYNPSWANQFKREKESLLKNFKGEKPIRIEHIGSTAIPHIKAKAIVDILIEAKADDFQKFKDLIIECGYILMSQSDHRMSFNKGYTEQGYADHVFHIHLRKENDHDEIYFRNHLIKHKNDAKLYETLKIDLSKQYKTNRDEYTKQKTECVQKFTQKGKIEHKLDVLKQIAQLFNEKEIIWNLGASAMLFLRGIVDDFSDLDLFVRHKDISRAKEVLESLGKMKPQCLSEIYKTDVFYEYVIDDVDIDLISGFKIIKDQKLYDLSFDENEIFDTYEMDHTLIYLDSIKNWLRFYEIMGRENKVNILKKYIHRSDESCNNN